MRGDTFCASGLCDDPRKARVACSTHRLGQTGGDLLFCFLALLLSSCDPRNAVDLLCKRKTIAPATGGCCRLCGALGLGLPNAGHRHALSTYYYMETLNTDSCFFLV